MRLDLIERARDLALQIDALVAEAAKAGLTISFPQRVSGGAYRYFVEVSIDPHQTKGTL